jgi:AraC-like DNA-binding protein
MIMKAIRKLFPNAELFPFQLVYKDTKSPQSELPNRTFKKYTGHTPAAYRRESQRY